jgi:hypothetical protein
VRMRTVDIYDRRSTIYDLSTIYDCRLLARFNEEVP